jgi:hypothetical protein
VDAERRRRDPAAAALAVLGLAALVAFAIGRHSWSGGSAGTRHVPAGLWDWISTVCFVLWLAASVLAFREYQRQRRGKGPPVKPVSWRKAALVFGALLLGLLLIARVHHLQLHPATPTLPTLPQTLTAPTTTGRPAPRREEHFRWEAAAATAGLLALAGVAWLVVSRRRGRPARRGAAAAALVEALDDSLDDLRNEPDPRKAVIAAYARMERSLAASGLPRHEAEAPDEYLDRVLAELDARPARRLTALFARAKFSPHTIDARMKDEAIDALVELRAELVE